MKIVWTITGKHTLVIAAQLVIIRRPTALSRLEGRRRTMDLQDPMEGEPGQGARLPPHLKLGRFRQLEQQFSSRVRALQMPLAQDRVAPRRPSLS